MPGNGNIREHDAIDAGVRNFDNNMEEDNEDLLLVNDELNLTTTRLRSDEKYTGFDNNVGDTWIYPSNFPERAYQYNIVQKALYHNTLVVLPTGLGKTFIAAVVMYNMYRWYPMGKVIFMAPTRPLVAQQIDACCKIMGIPKADSVEITGKLSKASRAQLWQSKRVFFATPQSVQSDILDAELNFPFHAVKLIVVDEAHKAKGRYAYTEVIRYIWSRNRFFRILALSATPGRRKEDVEEVIRNLYISNMEVRSEDSVDVVSYVHKRQLKVVVVELGTKLTEIRNELLEIADPHLRNLMENRLISGRVGSISRNWLLMEQRKFREMTQTTRVPCQRELNQDFSICISVYHAIELLERHGLRVFLNNFDETQEAGPKFVVILRPDLRRLVCRVREEIGPNPFAFSDQCMLDGKIADIPPDIDFGHPKFEIAREHVLEHFENNKDSRVIIFCEYRESVMLMHRLLLQHRPLIRPRLFVGQGGTGSIRAVTQQQQINVMNDFRSGKSNALIATAVAEEGIDVGEVDLIVCFDINTTNPTRFIQRIGRTGRKKEGKVLLLATEGKEHSMLKDVLSERSRLNKSISRDGQFNAAFYKQAPRMVPTEFNPKCLKANIHVPQIEEPKPKPAKTKGNKNSKIAQKKDMRHFFKQKVTLGDEDRDVFADPQAPSEQPKTSTSATRNEILSDEEIMQMSPPPPRVTDINNKMIKKMAKYIRNNNSNGPIEPLKAISSNKLYKNSLQFLLDFSPDLLSHIYIQMQTLWSKGINEYNIPLKGITAEDRQIIRAYLQVVNNVGCKDTVAALVESTKKSRKLPSYSIFAEKYNSIFDGMSHGGVGQENFELLMEKFETISKLLPSDEFSKESYPKSMVYDDEIDEPNHTTSVLNESSRDYSTECIMDSKYMSQWADAMSQSKSLTPMLTPKLNVSNTLANKRRKNIDQKPRRASNDSDDDVVFVATTHQSTPIRSGSFKQSLLNFNETPIASTSSKRPSPRIQLAKRSQKNILDFVKISKVQNNDVAPPRETGHVNLCIQNKIEESEPRDEKTRVQNTDKSPEPRDEKTCAQNTNKSPEPRDQNVCYLSTNKSPEHRDENMCHLNTNKSPEPRDENPMSFFDDQFDDIIAANCGIIERIENSNTANLKGPSTSKDSCGSMHISTKEETLCIAPETRKSPVDVIKTTPTLGLNDSTPDDILSLVDVTNVKPANQADSTTAGTHSFGNQTLKKLTQNYDGVHPELADIDINNLSEFSIEEIVESQIIKPAVQASASPHRASPDIFDDEICEPIPELRAKEKSPVRLTPPPAAEGSPCLLTKKALTWGQIRQKYVKSSESELRQAVADQRNDIDIKVEPKPTDTDDHPNESVVNVPSKIRSKRRIIISDSDSSNKEDCSPIRKRRLTTAHANQELNRKGLTRAGRFPRKRTNEFIDDEAVQSGSATEDELEHTVGQYIHDSVVVDDDEAENETSIPMTGVYLRSVRSPRANIKGAFKIPPRRQYNDASRIFSQRVPKDETSYMQDSFIVISDDDSDVERSMCPLERAEEILKHHRRAKRKAKLESVHNEFIQPAKKKRILKIHNSSEDDDDFA